MPIQIRTLTPTIGAEIGGVDLAGPLSNQQFDAIHQALLDHQVICRSGGNAARPSWPCPITAAHRTRVRVRKSRS